MPSLSVQTSLEYRVLLVVGATHLANHASYLQGIASFQGCPQAASLWLIPINTHAKWPTRVE